LDIGCSLLFGEQRLGAGGQDSPEQIHVKR